MPTASATRTSRDRRSDKCLGATDGRACFAGCADRCAPVAIGLAAATAAGYHYPNYDQPSYPSADHPLTGGAQANDNAEQPRPSDAGTA